MVVRGSLGNMQVLDSVHTAIRNGFGYPPVVVVWIFTITEGRRAKPEALPEAY